MSGAVKEAANLMEILPESDQDFALEFIKKLVQLMRNRMKLEIATTGY